MTAPPCTPGKRARSSLGGPTGADDAHRFLTTLRVNDENEPATNGTDGNEPFLQLGVLAVVEFEKIELGDEQLLGGASPDGTDRVPYDFRTEDAVVAPLGGRLNLVSVRKVRRTALLRATFRAFLAALVLRGPLLPVFWDKRRALRGRSVCVGTIRSRDVRARRRSGSRWR